MPNLLPRLKSLLEMILTNTLPTIAAICEGVFLGIVFNALAFDNMLASLKSVAGNEFTES